MSEVFFCADHHFGHKNIIKFTDSHGNRYRPFESIEEMHEVIIARHNSVVGKNDVVYFLGDITFNPKYLCFLNEMNGEKYLVKGNHDSFSAYTYLKYFKDIQGVVKKYDFVMSHVPVHPSQMDRWKMNVHGHLHAETIMLGDEPDLRYYNVSMEAIDFTPVHLSVITNEMLKREELKNGKY